MGYTRYWIRPRELDVKRFSYFAQACGRIGQELADTLALCESDQDFVRLVGSPNCEPLIIRRVSQGREREGVVTEFCKTQGLPYDLAVERCLQALVAEFPEVELPPPS